MFNMLIKTLLNFEPHSQRISSEYIVNNHYHKNKINEQIKEKTDVVLKGKSKYKIISNSIVLLI